MDQQQGTVIVPEKKLAKPVIFISSEELIVPLGSFPVAAGNGTFSLQTQSARFTQKGASKIYQYKCDYESIEQKIRGCKWFGTLILEAPDPAKMPKQPTATDMASLQRDNEDKDKEIARLRAELENKGSAQVTELTAETVKNKNDAIALLAKKGADIEKMKKMRSAKELVAFAAEAYQIPGFPNWPAATASN